MKPYDAKTERDRLKLSRDNSPARSDQWSILLSTNGVSLHAPDGTGYVSIPRKQFNALVDWYLTDQKPVKSERTASGSKNKEG